jgi:hypothetical protein
LVCVAWCVLFTVLVFALVALVERWVDRLRLRFARWLEERALEVLSLTKR